MLNISSLTPHFAIAAFAYIFFVFISESFNPFRMKPGQGLRKRWRLARWLALIIFLVLTVALVIEPHLGIPRSQLLAASAIICLVMGLLPIALYFRKDTNSTVDPTTEVTYEPHQQAPVTAPAPISSTSTDAKHQLTADSYHPVTATPSSKHNTSPTAKVHEVQNVLKSEEYELELELSQASHEQELDDLDQTIAEAEFFGTDATMSESYEIANPDRTASPDNSLEEGLDRAINLTTEKTNERAAYSNIQDHADQPIDEDVLIQKLATQNVEIMALAKRNQTLKSSRENLADELAETKYSLQKSQATARKSIAQLDQAVKIKNNALTLAAMERKKRQLTEIKARKALLRMKNSVRELADQRA